MQSGAVGRVKAKYSAAEALAGDGKLEEAERMFLEAKKLAESHEVDPDSSPLLLPNILSSLSLVQKKLGRHEKVLTTLKSLMRLILERKLSRLDHAVTLANIGTTLFFLGKLDVSLTYTLKANKMLERIANAGTIAQVAADPEQAYWLDASPEEKKRLLVSQVPACYNLAIVYHHLGCHLESGRCLNAAKTLAISKIGFNHRITDLVTKHAELKAKDGKPVFLALHFNERSLGLGYQHGRSRMDIHQPDREADRSVSLAEHSNRGRLGQREYSGYKFPTIDDKNTRQLGLSEGQNNHHLPSLKQARAKHNVLRTEGAKQPKSFLGMRPQTDNNDWSPAPANNYAAFGMQRVIYSGRPLTIGDAVGVRVTKLPSIHERPYFIDAEARQYGLGREPHDDHSYGHEENGHHRQHQAVRQESPKMQLHEANQQGPPRSYFDQGGLKRSHARQPNTKAASLSEEQRPRNVDPYNHLSRVASQEKSSSPSLSKPRDVGGISLNPALSKKKALQPMLQLSHFGFNEGELPTDDRDRVREYDEDSQPGSRVYGQQQRRSPLDDAFSRKFGPNGLVKSPEEAAGQPRRLDIDRLQINMRYLG